MSIIQMLQCVAVFMQRLAMCFSVVQCVLQTNAYEHHSDVALCCSVLQRDAVCIADGHCLPLSHDNTTCLCCSVLQRVAACCSVLQRVGVKYNRNMVILSTLSCSCNLCCSVL